MKKVIFLYSGEGTHSSDTHFKLLKKSAYWNDIAAILKQRFNLNLEKMWQEEIGKHNCPVSPMLTVISQICLSDLWKKWGYGPHLVIGHSIGELSAAFEAGFYSMEEILSLTYRIGETAAKLEGKMLHGTLTDQEISSLNVNLSALNFTDGDKKHVTLSGYKDEMTAFLKNHPDFTEMRPPHPWHHPDYKQYIGHIEDSAKTSNKDLFFVSGIKADFLDEIPQGYWKTWMTGSVDFITAFRAIKERFSEDELEIIEIGFHPVLKECCNIFGSYYYASSMYRGEDAFSWILYQRKNLDEDLFLNVLKSVINGYRTGLDYDTGLAYQDFTSRNFVEFTAILEPYFPGLAPQDFYRYKTVRQLVDQFGQESQLVRPSKVSVQKHEVVIAGMNCRFPESAQNPHQFWQTLMSGDDQVKANNDRGNYIAGFLGDDNSSFDYTYFHLSPAEAKTMDPQQLLALELTEMLWKDAGLDPAALDKKRVGVYIGVWNEEYLGDRNSVYYPTGTNPSIIASRISYHYDLRGPSWISNTACSSSLIAVHYACKDIEAGRVDYAIAGGVNMLLGNSFTGNMGRSGFLSKDSRCKAFDDSANGYVRAEGGGLVLLVRKDLAEKYYAKVLGSAINQNGGRAQVITAPHPEAQEEVILEACQEASIDPGDISYVECHGTGTKIGDPIEISALQNTVARNRNNTCFIGSVKSNIGHLESAAGIAGLIKAALILNYGKIPGNLHFAKPNQFIDFDTYHLKVVAEETPLPSGALVGISSFGFGGANAHVVLSDIDPAVKKAVEDLPSPFDREKALSLANFYTLDNAPLSATDNKKQTAANSKDVASAEGVEKVVKQIFANVTSINQIDADVELSDQGLDSMSSTEFVSQLESAFKVELDPLVLFDYPLIDQLVGHLHEKCQD